MARRVPRDRQACARCGHERREHSAVVSVCYGVVLAADRNRDCACKDFAEIAPPTPAES